MRSALAAIALAMVLGGCGGSSQASRCAKWEAHAHQNDKKAYAEALELAREEESLATVRTSITTEQQNPTLVAAVRVAQQANDPTPAQMAEIRSNLDKASGRIRGLQATAAEHEKNIEALKKELGALKP